MSRLDKIKARADAATKGPWLQDGPWWTDDGGPEPTALPCVVDVDRALVVFPPDATDVGMKRAEIAEAEVERLTDLCDEFRKREESQDCIRERLTAEVERLERWKFEATEVMSGLRELGKALGLGLGVQITGPAALAEVQRLTAERDALAQIKRHIDEVRNGTGWTVQIYGVLLQQCDQYGKTIDTRRAERAEAERDALAAAHARESEKVWKVEEVMDDIEGSDPTTWERLRAALAEPTDQEDQS